MKKTIFEQRLENAYNAFFEDESIQENRALMSANETAILRGEDATLTEKADRWFLNFKKALMFFPGVLILHLGVFATVFFYSDFGLNGGMLFWLISGFLMTWLGIGNLQNKKHLFIPTTVMTVGFLFAFLVKLLPFNYFEASFFVLPLMYVTAILTKGLIDSVNFENEVDSD